MANDKDSRVKMLLGLYVMGFRQVLLAAWLPCSTSTMASIF
jgi:hypothetical protein